MRRRSTPTGTPVTPEFRPRSVGYFGGNWGRAQVDSWSGAPRLFSRFEHEPKGICRWLFHEMIKIDGYPGRVRTLAAGPAIRLRSL
jgi:hypothetical protein